MTTVDDHENGYSVEDRYRVTDGEIYLTGTQALVRLLVDQRRRDVAAGLNTAGFASGYPGSPLGGVDQELNRRREMLQEYHIVHTPGLNEDLAATAVMGTQLVTQLPGARYDGVFAMWWGKAPGVDRSGDAFRHGNFRGTAPTGGVLAVAGDDPDAKSSILPTDSTRAFADWGMPVLFPGGVQEILDLGAHAFALSRLTGLAVGMKVVTEVADGAGTAQVGLERVVPVEVPRPAGFTPRVRMNVAGQPMREAEHELFTTRLQLARTYITANGLNRVVVDSRNARIGIVAAGKTWFDLRSALRTLGLDDTDLQRLGIRLVRFDALYPLDHEALRRFALDLTEVIVVEEKRELIEAAFREALYGHANAPQIVGKYDDHGTPLFPIFGELTSDTIARALGNRLTKRWEITEVTPAVDRLRRPRRTMLPLETARTPYFCSGCPHNRSMIVPDGAVVGAGIGCHIMALTQPRNEYGQIAGFTQMGGEGSQWIGIAPFTTTPHIFQNLGDGTFHHSGSLSVRAAVAAGVNITFKLLYNSAVGMTGGQDVAGGMSVPNLTRQLAAEGVRKIVITTEDPQRYRGVKLDPIATVRHRDELVEAQRELAAIPGVTVLIHDQQCAAERRRLRKRQRLPEPTVRIHIDERVCEGCGDCGSKSNCLSVQPVDTEFGRKTQVHQTSCNLDYSCLLGDCPSFLSVDVKHARPPVRIEAPDDATLDLPTELKVDAAGFTIHMVGIGGTGVVTASQILATAASLDGLHVRDLDLTGVSQKAGPVVSQLQLFAEPTESATSIGNGQADTLLVFDLLSAMSEVTLGKADPRRTVVVCANSRVPTGRMTVEPSKEYPDIAAMLGEIEARTRTDRNVVLDAAGIARTVLGSETTANMVLLGAAWQAGLLPISLASLRQAIKANGVAVDQNLAAFQWGRAAVGTPDAVPPVRSQRHVNRRNVELPSDLRNRIRDIGGSAALTELLTVRVPELIDYQDARYAGRYLDLVAAAATAERAVSDDDELTRAVARHYYTLLAYKDEYEVARLHLLPEAKESVEAQFGEGAKVYWNLHPPILRALGLKRKIKLGPWFRPVFVALANMKRLRGTKADVFGYARVRRVERALVNQYEAVMRAALRKVDAETLPSAIQLASLPDLVRGYEEVKLRNVAQYQAQLHEVANRLDVPVPPLTP